MGLPVWGPTAARKVTSDANWKLPLRWNRAAEKSGEPTRVFCASLSDVFEDRRDLDPVRRRLWALIEQTPALTWQLLTKRPQHVHALSPWCGRSEKWPANVWIGTTVEDQPRAEERVPWLLRLPAPVKFLSCEPLLGAVDLDPPTCSECDGHDCLVDDETHMPYCRECGREMEFGCWLDPLNGGISWVIVGSESGGGARPMDAAWAQGIVDTCRDRGTACFVKQVATPAGRAAGDPKGGDPRHWPPGLAVREFPEAL